VEIKILDEKPNPLLHRREFVFEVSHATAATPRREEVRGEFAKLAKAPKDRVIIERMRARYGTATTRGEAVVYETVEAAKVTEREHILIRNGLKEKAAKGPAAPAEPEPTPKAEPAKAEPPKAETPAPKV
jgi:ribosomal protein S24E